MNDVITQILLKQLANALFRSLGREKTSIVLMPYLNEISNRLGRIEGSLEDNKATPLRAGVEFLRLDAFEDAQRELVRAVAADHRGAVSRLFLAALVFLEGRDGLAKQYLAEALEINPYLLATLLPKCGVELATVISPLKSRPTKNWQCTLNDSIGKFRTRNWWQRLLWSDLSEAYVSSASACGERLFLLWHFAADLKGDDEITTVLSCFDYGDGSHSWSAEVNAFEILLSTPTFVVLAESGSTNEYNLIYSDNGRDGGRMSQAYLETVFCPRPREVRASATYQKLNVTFEKNTSILQRGKEVHNAERGSRSVGGHLLNAVAGEPSFDFKTDDERQLSVGGRTVVIGNQWKYKMRVKSYGHGTKVNRYFLECSTSAHSKPS